MGSREKVLEAAQEIFSRKGYQAASIDQILESAGVSPSNFYYHFDSKEALALEVIERYMQGVAEETKPILADPDASPARKLEGLHRYFMNVMIQNDCCGG
jgi:AcrR family transcriptional regulator